MRTMIGTEHKHTHTQTQTQTQTQTPTHTHTHTHTYTHTNIHTHTHKHKHTPTPIHTDTRTHALIQSHSPYNHATALKLKQSYLISSTDLAFKVDRWEGPCVSNRPAITSRRRALASPAAATSATVFVIFSSIRLRLTSFIRNKKGNNRVKKREGYHVPPNSTRRSARRA